MFDKAGSSKRDKNVASGVTPNEDERIALRCQRRELQLIDSFVVTGEFRSRSELMRAALRDFLRIRALPPVAALTPDPMGAEEVPVRLRRDEVETLTAYGDLVANGQKLPDVLAGLVRRGALELKISELVAQTRSQKLRAEETRANVDGLRSTATVLERKGVVGR